MAAGTPPEAGALAGFDLAPETVDDLRRFVALLGQWQRTHNLVASSTLSEVWSRHVADSLQLLRHAAADFREWIDLGSGAGFPGLVVAIASKPRPERHFTLVESNQKKAAFLRAAIRATGANTAVAAERIETHAETMRGRADVVSARALAPLATLLPLAQPYLRENGLMLFLKGRDYAQEIEAAARHFVFDVLSYPSATDSGGRVLVIRNLRPARPRQ